jgi:hypothetical protein
LLPLSDAGQHLVEFAPRLPKRPATAPERHAASIVTVSASG